MDFSSFNRVGSSDKFSLVDSSGASSSITLSLGILSSSSVVSRMTTCLSSGSSRSPDIVSSNKEGRVSCSASS